SEHIELPPCRSSRKLQIFLEKIYKTSKIQSLALLPGSTHRGEADIVFAGPGEGLEKALPAHI
ncbi:MAG: hypothetical protein ACREVW_18950, partial [Burkholderiales bacterium]